MHKFSANTLELFRVHQWGISRHLDKITNDADRSELIATLYNFKAKNDECRNCAECVESIEQHGFVCELHYHDYCNQGPECCWSCYVSSVHERQLGIWLE